MGFIGDFIAGRTHKLARDFLVASCVIIAMCLGAISLLTAYIAEIKMASRQPIPPRVATLPAIGQTQTVVRSILDDNVTTASIGGRSIVIDPCTGKEKQ